MHAREFCFPTFLGSRFLYKEKSIYYHRKPIYIFDIFPQGTEFNVIVIQDQ